MARMTYRVRKISLDDAVAVEAIRRLHNRTFAADAPPPNLRSGHWWIAWRGKQAVAFAGVIDSSYLPGKGYFCRVGVLKAHRGHGLQCRLMRAIERAAVGIGWARLVSDTTADNPHSANNFRRRGWEIFKPSQPWGLARSIYWRKKLR